MRIRRLRKARRLWKKVPLFAFQQMCEDYPEYTLPDFLDDLRRRSPPRKKKGKSQLQKYGRYERMCKLMREYKFTQDIDLALQAQKLRERIAQPYRVMVKVEKKKIEHWFSPLIPIDQIETLVKELGAVSTEQEAEVILAEFRRWQHVT